MRTDKQAGAETQKLNLAPQAAVTLECACGARFENLIIAASVVAQRLRMSRRDSGLGGGLQAAASRPAPAICCDMLDARTLPLVSS